MRMRYDENLDQTIIAVKNSRDEPEKDIVWLKGNILSLKGMLNNKKSVSTFVIPYNSKTGFSITMTCSKVSIRDDKKSYILSDEFKDAKGSIVIELDETRHEYLRACRSYDQKMKENKYSKYIFEKYGLVHVSRIEGICHEEKATYNISCNGNQYKLDFDKKGLCQKGIQILANGEEKEITGSEAHRIYSQANYGQLMAEHRIKLMPVIVFKYNVPNTGEVKLIPTEDWSHPMPLTSELVEKQRRLKKDYKKILCSTAVVIPMILAGFAGIQKCQSIQSKEPAKAKQIQKGQNATVNRQIQKQKDEKSY